MNPVINNYFRLKKISMKKDIFKYKLVHNNLLALNKLLQKLIEVKSFQEGYLFNKNEIKYILNPLKDICLDYHHMILNHLCSEGEVNGNYFQTNLVLYFMVLHDQHTYELDRLFYFDNNFGNFLCSIYYLSIIYI